MRKNSFIIGAFVYLLIFMCFTLVSCDNEQTQEETPTINSPSDDPTTPIETEEKYTVAFFNNNELVYKTVADPGTFVDIPTDLVSPDPRYKFIGWEGIDDYDLEAGKVEVFHQDAFYYAIWSEQFGTEQKFSVTQIPSSDSIFVDGEMDDVYLSSESVTVNTVTEGDTNTNAFFYFMFDDNYLYIFANVIDSTVYTRDYSYVGEQWIEHNDAVEIWIDLLHDDIYAGSNWTGGWGGSYRGEPGPMCEAHFKINAGYNPDEHGRFGAGSEAIWDGWWSNSCNTDNESYGVSKVTETGYTIEYKVKLTDPNIPENLRMNDGQEIGIGIKIYDKKESDGAKNVPAKNVITLEAINHDMSGPKKLSNFIVIGNSN